MTEGSEAEGFEWAVIEVFGHRRHVGRIREEERFGCKMLRVDIPIKGDPEANGWQTHYYAGSALFSCSLTDEASALKANKPYSSPGRLSYRDEYEDDHAGNNSANRDEALGAVDG